ncbi:MAG: response regulator [Candidatus Eisenbacteria bacterium]|nr:response regulator [Candidatus Eisenbacteria bacterium]
MAERSPCRAVRAQARSSRSICRSNGGKVNDAADAAATQAPTRAPGRSAHILVIDDEESIRISLSEGLADARTRVSTAIGGAEAYEALRAGDVDLVLLDQRLSATQEDGLELLGQIKADFPEVPVIMMTAYGRFEKAVEATRLGCYQYIGKPLDLHQLQLLIRHALDTTALTREVRLLRAQQRKEFAIDAVVGHSAVIRRLLADVKRAAGSRTAAVLLRGETGAGKELIARQIHYYSPVSTGPFVDVNCSAVPEQLLESELFGHERGAFTDAKAAKPGLFELADRGTLFLDEIAEMPPNLQAKLLRVLESMRFRRVGGTQDLQVAVRIVSATNRDLSAEIASGRFRQDLYYRLAVVPLEVPPLRERRDDIPALIKTFVEFYRREIGREVRGVSAAAMDALCDYHWPGNVRELKNLIERLVLMGGGAEIELGDLPLHVRHKQEGPLPLVGDGDLLRAGHVPTLAEVERAAIAHALAECGGNKTRAASCLGIARQTLRAKIREYGIPDPSDG